MPHALATCEQTSSLTYPSDILDYDVYAAPAQQQESLLSGYDELSLDFWLQMGSLPICECYFIAWPMCLSNNVYCSLYKYSNFVTLLSS